MKIENQSSVTEAARLYSPAKTANTGPSFSDLLSQAVEGQTCVQETKPTRATSAASSAASLGQPPLWSKANNLVDSLETYGAALANPNLTLKQLEPLTLSLESQADELAGSLEKSGDDSLNSLAWQAVYQARAEVLKFRRGDYV